MRNDKFIFLKEWLDLIDYFPEDKQLLLVKSIIEIGLEPENSISIYPTELRPTLLLVKESILKMQRKYKARSEAGKRGMASRWHKEERKDDKEMGKVELFVNRFNSINGVVRCERISQQRKENINNILTLYKEDEINTLFSNIESSDFFLTKDIAKVKFSIDFLLDENNFQKILEGNYNDKKTSKIKELWK